MGTIRKITAGLEKKYWLNTFLSPFVMIGEVVMETLIPFLMAKIIDIGISSHNMTYVLHVGGIMVLCAVVSLCFGAGGARFGAVAALGFARNLRRNLFKKVQSFSFANVDHFSSASLVTRLTTDVTNVQNVYQMICRICFRAPFMLVAGTLMAFKINAELALVFIVAIPVLAAAVIGLSAAAYPRFSAMLKKYDKMNSIVQENLIAIRVVKAFVRGGYEDEKFENAAKDVRNAQVRAEKIVIALMPFMQIVVYVCIIWVLWFGGKMIVFGSMKAGELVSFLTYVTQILMSLMMIGMIFVNIVLSRASINRICQVLDEMPDISNPKNPVMTVTDGSVDFENVSFSYNKNKENFVLSDINLHINSGNLVGIIGGTGSSKTTLVSLIPRLYDVASGVVKLGGINVKDYDLKTLRDNVAVVLQKNVLFSGTIKENLRWGKKDASDEEIIAACKVSDADSFIQTLPDGYETELGQGGVNLSGGQKQRLCIARALLKKPKILILDDSTSAVDTSTEKRIREALCSLHPEITKIVIAQRISSVKDSDIIFVLDDGKVNGSGTHDELLKNNRIYKEVYESQSSLGDADIN